MTEKINRVFLLGAGASKSCGLPLTNEMLVHVLPAFEYNETGGDSTPSLSIFTHISIAAGRTTQILRNFLV